MPAPLTVWHTGWQDFIAAEEVKQYHIQPEQITAFNAFFSDPTIPVSEIARQISVPIIKALEEKNQETKGPDTYRYGTLWRTMGEAIRQLTDFNDRFVDLVLELQKTPDPTGLLVCLDDFHMEWTERVFSFRDLPSWDPNQASERQGWLNLNRFGAKLSLHPNQYNLEITRAGSVFRNCLERTPWEETSHPDLEEDDGSTDWEEWRSHELELRSIKNLDATVPAAAAWIKINPKGVHEMEGDMNGEYAHNATNWKGRTGWSKERFRFWRNRFQEISHIGILDERTREDAKEAAEIMSEIE